MFSFIKKTLSKIYQNVSSRLGSLFSQSHIDQETIKKLERILIEADTGASTTKKISKKLQEKVTHGDIVAGVDLQKELATTLRTILSNSTYTPLNQGIYLLVGVNGSGKTTSAGKLATWYKNQGKKVLLAAADTFRAAAVEQLETIAKRTGVALEKGQPKQDPASVVYRACERYQKENFDILIIDTAGRLQTKANLMKELEKIRKIITKTVGNTACQTLLTVDAMLGQNSFDQARLFNESTQLTGIVLTKLDGTGKGGIVFSIVQELKVPIAYMTFGEKMDQLKLFNPEEYVSNLVNS